MSFFYTLNRPIWLSKLRINNINTKKKWLPVCKSYFFFLFYKCPTSFRKKRNCDSYEKSHIFFLKKIVLKLFDKQIVTSANSLTVTKVYFVLTLKAKIKQTKFYLFFHHWIFFFFFFLYCRYRHNWQFIFVSLLCIYESYF